MATAESSKLILDRTKDFFLQCGDGICIVQKEFVQNLSKREVALVIAMNTYAELFRIMDEELKVGTLYIGNIPVTRGLQRGLKELERRYPFLMKELLSIPSRRFNGKIIATS
jgi:hypothetical protein